MKRFVTLLLSLALVLPMVMTFASAESAEPPVFRLFGQTDANDGPWADMYMFKHIQEKFGIKLDITEINSSIWNEKISIAFATEDYPDFFLNGLSNTDIQTYGSQGIIIDLKDYITEEKTPNIYKVYQDYPQVRAASMSYDGHLYVINGYDRTNTREYGQARFFLNKKWAENLGVKVPTTLDEFYEYLKAVKEGDADLDGDPDNEIPILGSFENDPFSLITIPLTAYGYAICYGSGERFYVDVKDGKVIFVPTEDRFKDALEFMKKLYDEKLLDPEYFTQTGEQVDAKQAAMRAGCFMDWAQWLDIPNPDNYNQYDGIVPLTTEYNDTPIWPSYDVKTIGQFVVTDKCQNVEKLMEIADWAVTFDAYCTLLGGAELGTVEGMDYGYTIERFDESYGENALTLNYTRPDSYESDTKWREALVSPGWGALPLCRIDFTFVESSITEVALSDALNNNYTPYLKVGWPASVKFSGEENDTISLIVTDLKSYLDQMVAKFITGEESLDNFDAFKQGCMDRGLEQYLSIYQTAYDRFMANQ